MGRRNSGNCALCGVWRYSLHGDHINPRFKGGIDSPENIQWICANCHEDKTRIDLTGRKFPHRVGRPLSEEHKQKISASNKGKRRSDETRARMSEAQKKVRKKPHILKALLEGAIQANTGHPLSEDHKAKLRSHTRTEEQRENYRRGWEKRRAKEV